MAEKPYEWAEGATLEDHSRRKHKILREYFAEYLAVRCQHPQQERFRLAIVEGFAGGGRYKCGTAGSPVIFIEELKRAIEGANMQRAVNGFALIEMECLLILNDLSRDAIEGLKGHMAPLQAEIAESVPRLHLRVEYLNHTFEGAYPRVKEFISAGRYRNVLFNLDQCGHSRVEHRTLLDIMRSTQHPSVEVFYTFAIEALLSFLEKSDPDRLKAQLRPFGINSIELGA
ncbi:three-Cys-motif partner protein TcmP [Sphingosinicella sp. CPCC 101087]|uniref:three-Cys-motif partner protein TcmP n=1 Tax=Sphingosinicella sp. CPCC 101087 TaxID=2497754 RepID=UPI001FB0A462|nr:three-Cys-motif partner protein TcmP [Sphingosinicella sp. CPCC 101087]